MTSPSAPVSGAVIAAGEGSRLKELGRPKPLVEVAGSPLIAHVLSNFEAAGIVSAAVIFNESERDCEAYVRQRYPRLVSTVLVKNTHSSFESFREILKAAPPGRLLVSTVDAFCPRRDFVGFVGRAADLPPDATVLAVTGYVHDEKPLWVRIGKHGRVAAIGGNAGDAVTAGIYVVPERVRTMAIPDFPRLRDFLAWLAKQDEPIEAVSIEKVVDVDRVEDLAEAELLAALDPPLPAGEGTGVRVRA